MHPILSVLLVFALAIIAAQSVYSFIIGAPILFSPKKAISEALKYCNAKQGENFYDLGSGTGRSMLIANKKFGLCTYGFELSLLIALIAKCNLWLNRVDKSTIYIKNFYNEDLSNADIIFCFLTPKAMLKLRDKFAKELKTGTRIISYAFSVPEWKPEKIIFHNAPGKMFCYLKK